MQTTSIIKSAVLLAALVVVPSNSFAAPDGNFNLQIQTKFPWPMAATVSGDKIALKSRGRTKIIGSTKTKGASKTKISGTANFSTAGTGGREGCNQKSTVTVTLKFNKDGSFKSGSAKGKCVRDSGKNGSFSGKVALR